MRIPFERLLEPRALVPLGCVAGIALSWPLWITAREYPPVPMFGLPALAWPFDWILALQLVAACLWMIVAQDKRHPAAMAGVTFIILAMFDQSRLQPWIVLEMFLMLAIGFLPVPTAAIRFTLVGTYFWSGIQKFNAVFFTGVFPWFIEPTLTWLPIANNEELAPLAAIVPAGELAIALALLVPKLRRFALFGGFLMHGFILLMLGPLGHGWNAVVWPWNLLMIGLLYYATTELHPRFTIRELLDRKQPLALAILVWFGLLPILHAQGLWDSYLSSALYTGNTHNADLIVQADRLDRLPRTARSVARPLSEGRLAVDFLSWSMAAVHVPAYPEPRIYRSVARTMCGLDETLTLRIYARPDPFTGKTPASDLTCAHLR